jgi:hypothetical protein
VRADERERLGPWVDAFTRVLGVAPTVAALAPPSPDAPTDLFTITFPVAAFQPVELLGGTGHFRHSPALVEHMRRLGFAWNESGRVVTAPTPSTFNALLERLGEPDAGYRVIYLCEDATTLSMAPWLLRYLSGALPVHVASGAWYARPIGRGEGQLPPEGLAWQLTSLAHDLTVHALNYHRVPRAAIDEIHRRVRTGLPERHDEWSRGGRAPLTMSMFIDNDLNRYCYGVWCRCQRPDDFGRVFVDDRNYRQLLDALALRIDETRAGKGDAPSGDTNDLPPLGKVEFTVR